MWCLSNGFWGAHDLVCSYFEVLEFTRFIGMNLYIVFVVLRDRGVSVWTLHSRFEEPFTPEICFHTAL